MNQEIKLYIDPNFKSITDITYEYKSEFVFGGTIVAPIIPKYGDICLMNEPFYGGHYWTVNFD